MISSNKTIAKNAIFMYIRMFLTLGVALFTSRVILQNLGVDDFGIYNLVAGVVVAFSFLNASMNAATQRFINFEKASLDLSRINRIFNVSIQNHVLISLFILLIAESFGIWFLNSKLNIPPDRIYAANVVFQLSVFTTIIDVLRVPYNAIILAYEKMSFYAYVGIFEVVAKLFAVYLLLLFSDSDQLIVYASLILLVNFFVNLILHFYCKKNFAHQTTYKLVKDLPKLKELLSFSGWMTFGQIAVMLSTQGLSIILNMFYGVGINASIGIANQVNGAIYSFVTNFQTAFNPQIVQTYANGESTRNRQLILATSKYSFFLIVALSAPILFYTKSILVLWLGENLPDYTVSFAQVVILCALIDALSGPFWMAASAIGEMKKYSVILTVINFCTLPIVYILLKLGVHPSLAYLGRFFTYALMQVYRYYFVNRHLGFRSKELKVYFTSVGIIALSLFLLIVLTNNSAEYSILQMIIGVFSIELTLLVMIYLFGLSKIEKETLSIYIKKFSTRYF